MTGTVLEYLGETKLALGPVGDREGNWRTGRDQDGITWLVLDVPDSSANTISEDVIRELDAHISAIKADLPKAVVIRSATLSCNTDISADLFAMRSKGEMAFTAVAEINVALPFMEGPAAVLPEDAFAMVLDPPQQFELFSAVRRPVSDAQYAIGLHVSRLIKDSGTLQIGRRNRRRRGAGPAVARTLCAQRHLAIGLLPSVG